MNHFIDKDLCTGCSACANACEKKAITMNADLEGFLYPSIDESKCINCKKCERTCPVMRAEKYDCAKPIVYAAKGQDSTILTQCSSGGIFSYLSGSVINESGVVFGAAFNDNLELEHKCVYAIDEISKLYGSKYMQSSVASSYVLCKELLANGRKVLFSGTPCQIAGLCSYLDRDYEKLITVEVVCHGVPSQFVFKRYLRDIKHKLKSDVLGVSFRDKETGWEAYSVKYSLSDGSTFSINHEDDKYMKAFLRNLSIRPSCYRCNFKKGKSKADLTLGDFWGIEDVIPDYKKQDGVSLVMCNTNKGMEFFEQISSELIVKQVDYNDAVQKNPSYSNSPVCPGSRKLFFKDIRRKSFTSCVNMYCSDDEKMINRVQLKEDCWDVRMEKGRVVCLAWAIKNYKRFINCLY